MAVSLSRLRALPVNVRREIDYSTLGAGSKSRLAHHQFAVVKRWENQDRPKIIFADSGQLASEEASL